jgi:hypothetical protein
MVGSKTSPAAVRYLRRVLAAGLADRFQFGDVLEPLDRFRYLPALDVLLDLGHVERVKVACGRWWYRVTAKGKSLAEGKAEAVTPAKCKARPDGRDPRHLPRRFKRRKKKAGQP